MFGVSFGLARYSRSENGTWNAHLKHGLAHALHVVPYQPFPFIWVELLVLPCGGEVIGQVLVRDDLRVAQCGVIMTENVRQRL